MRGEAEESASARTIPAQFTFPRAAQSEIVRAHQKDLYYRDLFHTQLKEAALDILGARRSHVYAELLSLVASVAYAGLSTMGGAQSLGEEYVNSMMRYRPTGKTQRVVFIALYVIAPYAIKRAYGALRALIVREDQRIARRRQRMLLKETSDGESRPHKTPLAALRRRLERAVQWLAIMLPGMHVLSASNGWLAYLSAAQLALFYLFGRYYTLAHRIARVDYIYASTKRPNSRPRSYEVLGVLLSAQLVVKFGMSVHAWYQGARRKYQYTPQTHAMHALGGAQSEVRPKRTIQLNGKYYSHADGSTTQARQSYEEHVVPLEYPDPDAPIVPEQLGFSAQEAKTDKAGYDAAVADCRARTTQMEAVAEQVLRCTLCMDRREPDKGGSAVTECGHVFCWGCITGWAKEKAECPLCRHTLQPCRLLPIYNL
ncbi:Pex10p [Malassezia vespertilionis]|uniref:RING-type E3 ubiquitin transferase n=1 Tax=Malassezia vespertilionis TaxID=2020962 RepID=A0A2N1JD70_9BASI|nr:Pex10p [Malassezia vespertilionis]